MGLMLTIRKSRVCIFQLDARAIVQNQYDHFTASSPYYFGEKVTTSRLSPSRQGWIQTRTEKYETTEAHSLEER